MTDRSTSATCPSASAALTLAGALLLASATAAGGQSHRIRFDHLTLADGLSQSSGNAILQDSRGFIWVGTEDGLNRFDGYGFEVFRHDPDDPDSLADNFVTSLFEDQSSRLWIFFSQPGLLSIFDLDTERFERLAHDPDDPASLPRSFINSGQTADDGSLWLGTQDAGIARHDPRTGRVTAVRHDPDDPESLASDRVTAVLKARDGTLWIATRGALHRRLPPAADGRQRFERYVHDEGDAASLSHEWLTGIFEDSDGILWIGTNGGGLNRFDPATGRCRSFFDDPEASADGRFALALAETGDGTLWIATGEAVVRLDRTSYEVRRYRHDPADPRSLGSERIRAFLEDRTGVVWIGTDGGGLNRYDPETDAFVVYRHQPSDPTSLSNDFPRVLYEDRSGILWIGTYGGGVDRYSRDKHKFVLYRHDAEDPESLDDDTIFPIYEDRAGTLWVATLGGGLNRFDESRQRVVARYFDEPGLSRPAALLEDREGRFWVGTNGSGLALFDRGEERIVRRYVHDDDDATSLPSDNVISLFQDSRGDLWVGSVGGGGGGWARFDPERGTFRLYQNDPQDPASLAAADARITHEDRDGELWVTHSRGISRFHRDTETFTHHLPDPRDPASLSHRNVMGLYEDGDGFFWITTYGGGLNRFDPRTGKAEVFTTKDGLPSDALYGILPDDDGHLWISSNGGLAELDPGTMTFTNYDVDDGLQSNEFNDRSFYRGRNGELFFGGVDGLNSFRPEEIRRSEYKPPVVLTSFVKFGRRQELDRSGGENTALTVSYKENFFSFEFASLDYSSPEKNLYAYKLEGFNDDWIEAGNRRFASYTNLDGAAYVFRVRGTNSDGVWNDEGASIRVVVTTPPWKTWWAYSLYVLALAGTVLGYVRYQTAAQKEELRRQREEAARLRQIDRMKDEFLANTSHELRTPLNGIIGIAQSLLDGATGELSDPTRSNLFMVVSSSRRLAHLVDDILDFSKLRKHQIELRRSPVNLRDLGDDVLTLSRPLVTGKSLELVNEVAAELPAVDADANRLQQIFHNVIGNAVKFTQAGSVRISARSDDGQVEVTVADTGIGIPADKLESIFESFEQADGSTARTYGGTGLGLTITRQLVELHGGEIRLESELGAGTRVIFTLPRWSEDGAGAAESEAVTRSAGGASQAFPMLAQVRDLEPVEPVHLEDVPKSGNGDGAGVMIVDDEPVNLQVLRNVLTLEGFRISQAFDGTQCLELLREGTPPDIILLDVMMPGMTGFEVTQEIRRRFSANDLPILLVTAKNQVRDLEQGLASGANDYLTKPFSKSELLARMRTHLSLARAHTLEAENRRQTEELEQARAIQLSLLPKAPPAVPFLDIAVHMETATEVGGDYYDFFTQEDGAFYLVTGDATGHGISAGMVVSMTKSALKALEVKSPHVLLRQLNRVLRAVHLERMQMALNVTYVTENELAVSSAAMPPPYLYRPDGGVEEVLLPGLPLGGLEQADYDLRVLEFGPGDVLLQVSDGLPELVNGDGELLGYDAISSCLAAHGDRSAAQVLEALLELGRDWAGERPAADDVTAVVLKHR